MTLLGATFARSLRNFAYGGFAVVFAIGLTERGFSITFVGGILSAAMLSGALFSLSTGPLERRLGSRATLVSGSLAMAAAGALAAIARRPELAVAAALLGTLSPGGQEVGPFAAIEQTAIARAGDPARTTRRFAIYNLAGTAAAALGALASGVLGPGGTLWTYAAVGVALAVVYATTDVRGDAIVPGPPAPRRWGRAESLAALFGLDALAGGLVVQTFIAYWFAARFGAGRETLAGLFFGVNALSAASFLAAAPLAERFGNLRTMVFTHVPSNLLLMLVPLMPTYPLAATVLLARSALSQMDVPTRQAFTMTAVEEHERSRAAGLTNAVRPAAAALTPLLSGIAFSSGVSGLAFFVAGGLKIVYDLTIFAAFRALR